MHSPPLWVTQMLVGGQYKKKQAQFEIFEELAWTTTRRTNR
jgi:hypothetical protein